MGIHLYCIKPLRFGYYLLWQLTLLNLTNTKDHEKGKILRLCPQISELLAFGETVLPREGSRRNYEVLLLGVHLDLGSSQVILIFHSLDT